MFYTIRALKREDAEKFAFAFSRQGLDLPETKFLAYYSEQQSQKRKVFVAEYHRELLGFITLVPCAKTGSFKNRNIPEIDGFYIFKEHQGNGIGSLLLDKAEEFCLQKYDEICLGLSLSYEYGRAQKMLAAKGYIPDGTGIWYNGKILENNETAINNENLKIYLSKKLKKMRNNSF